VLISLSRERFSLVSLSGKEAHSPKRISFI
jgi:hypothetical protein